MSQPTTTAPDSDVPQLASEYVYLGIAILAGALAVVIWLLSYMPISGTTSNVLGDVGNALHVIAGIGAGGYLIRSAEGRVERRVDRHAPDEDEIYQRGYAAGFVDCATGRSADSHTSATVRSLH